MAADFTSNTVQIVDAIGSVDGINTDFASPEPFQVASVFGIVGGVAVTVSPLDSSNVRFSSAPVIGDKVRLQYAKA